MKIGFLIYGSLDILSGGYMYDRKLVESLRSQGDTVEIISLPWRNYAAHLTDNITFKLPRNFDILVQDELNHPSLIGANRGGHSCPIISLVHHLRCSELRPHWQNVFYRAIERKYLQNVDGFIFNSRTTKSVVDGLLVHMKPSIVAYPPTDRLGEVISMEAIHKRSRQNPFRILFLGNVIERKGLHTLLDAVSRLPAVFKLDIVGSLTTEPKYAKHMQDRVLASGLSSFVKFHFSLDHEQLKTILRAAHVLVVPSSYEGFGIVYLEGMAFGLPAIGTTAGAAGEIISHETDGFLIEPGDSDSLADRLRVLNEKRKVLLHMSLAARERYNRQPKWHQTAGQIREFLRSF